MLEGGKFSEQVLTMETSQVVQVDVILLWIWGGQGVTCNGVLLNLLLQQQLNPAILSMCVLCYGINTFQLGFPATWHWVKDLGSLVSNPGTSHLPSQSVHLFTGTVIPTS